MYVIKEKYKNKKNNKQFNNLIKKYNIKQIEIAEIIGVHKTYISQVANGKETSKLCAYGICKAISNNLEIKNLFNIKNN